MSIEAALAENTAALKAHTSALALNNGHLERVIAGQGAALEAIHAKTGGAAPKPATPKKDAPAAKPPETTPAAPKPEAAKSAVSLDDQVKAAGQAYMGTLTDEQKKTVGTPFLVEMLQNFGVGGKLTGPECKLSDDQKKQATFFLLRKAAGLEVNFKADYDFDGDVKQGAAATEEDPFA